MAHRSTSSPYVIVGPAVLQALQLARYQALNNIGKGIVPATDENDVINQEVTPEEERILISNAAVVSALEGLFSWINKDRTSRTSRLSNIESWRFRRALYRVWMMSTLFGFGSPPHKRGATSTWTEQKDFLQKFTSNELVQISKVARFLRSLAGWVVLAEGKLVGSLDVYDFDGLYLFAGPHIILRCYEEETSGPLPFGSEDEIYENFLPSEELLSERSVTLPLAFVGSILDRVCGGSDKCHRCGRDGLRGYLPVGTEAVPDLYNETNWERLKGRLGTSYDIFIQLPYSLVEKELFKTLKGANYSVLFHELFALRHDPNNSWSKQDWICMDCLREFFLAAVLRWWRDRKSEAGESIPENCRYGYYCKQQGSQAGLDHARRFNHLCEPVDIAASIAQLHSR